MSVAGFQTILSDILKSPMKSIMDLGFGFTLYNTLKDRDNNLLVNRDSEFILWR